MNVFKVLFATLDVPIVFDSVRLHGNYLLDCYVHHVHDVANASKYVYIVFSKRIHMRFPRDSNINKTYCMTVTVVFEPAARSYV